jgi:ABC-type nickel/cobalt efflux system permease component RcnA
LLLVAVAIPGEALARGPVFGVARPEGGFSPADWGPLAPLAAQIAAWQSALYQVLSGLVRDFSSNPHAAVMLIGFSFAYGVLHAAGPGHGKAVISSYLLASGEGVRRGLVLSFAAAGVQALSAILVVSVLAGILNASSMAMTRAGMQLELASYALIALMGAFLVVRKLAALARLAWRPAAAVAGHHHDHHPGGNHDHHSHGGSCGHAHGVDPGDLPEGPLGARRAALAVFAVGIRPCSGAVLVLVFALAQGVYGAGVAAVLAMGLGTGITVAAIALLVLGARGVAARLAARRPGAGAALFLFLELAGSLAILLIGLVLFAGTLGNL